MSISPSKSHIPRENSGFTLLEAVIVLAVIGILAAVAAPGLMNWLPSYHLKEASRDLYGHLQFARSSAISENKEWAVVFDTAGSGRYLVCSNKGADNDWAGLADNTVVRTVNLGTYGSGVRFGHGPASKKVVGPGAVPADNVDYPLNVAAFNSNGTGVLGFAYLQNSKNQSYAMGTYASGVVILKRWVGSDWN